MNPAAPHARLVPGAADGHDRREPVPATTHPAAALAGEGETRGSGPLTPARPNRADRQAPGPGPYLLIGGRDPQVPLRAEVTTAGRGDGVDIWLEDPTVSVLHAELVRRGPYVYAADLGLSRNGTTANGRPITRALLGDGDVICFGTAMCQIGGITAGPAETAAAWMRPELTRREAGVLAALCQPALAGEVFCQPALTREIAQQMGVTEAAVKQHLLRLYDKFAIPPRSNRRARLANAALMLGFARPDPAVPQPDVGHHRTPLGPSAD